ncbi:MAG: LuxR C-terminal-related transcriptional regulator [Acidobacteriota bacterium]|nr:LuxR C-terminal-related transcriptional regulator [Acidobacteriota bacterium]
MEAALDAIVDGIVIEANEQIIYSNAAYAALLGYRRSTDILRRPIPELVADFDVERLIRYGRMRVHGQRAPASYDFAARRSDGSVVRVQASVSLSVSGGTPYITTIARPFSPDRESEESADGTIAGPHDVLSNREYQVMEMLLAGKRPKIIALELDLSETTVATHRTRLLAKIGVADNRELFQYALRHRLVDWS